MENNLKKGRRGFKISGQFFTQANFATLGGCVAMTLIVTSVLCGVFKLPHAPVGLIVAIIVAVAAVFLSQEKKAVRKYIIAVFNGFLIYLTAVGATSFTPYVNPNTPDVDTGPRVIKPWVVDKNFVEKTQRQGKALSNVENELAGVRKNLRDLEPVINIATTPQELRRIYESTIHSTMSMTNILRAVKKKPNNN